MNMIRLAYSRPVVRALVIAIVWYGALWLVSQDKLIYTDEIGFAQDMARIAQGHWAEVAIPHPPLYTWLAGIVTRVFGYNLPALRMVGALSFVATLLLIPPACVAFFKQNAARTALIAITIYAIHPLALQGSLLLDIDNTLFTPVLLLFVTALALSESLPRAKGQAFIALSFALMLWTKLLPSALIVSVAALLVYAWRRTGFGRVAVGMALGLVIFAVTFGTFAALVHFPLGVFAATFQRTAQPVSGGMSLLISRALMGGGITASWIGIPFVLAYLYLIGRHALTFLRSRQVEALDVLILSSATGMVLYSIGNELPMGFPRYHYPMFLLIVLIVSNHLAAYSFGLWRARYALLGAAMLGVLYFALFVPDPLLPQYALTFDTNSLVERLTFGLRLQITVLLVPFALVWLVLWVVVRNPSASLRVAWPSFCLAAWLVLTLMQARAPYATIYEYGRLGAAQASSIVRARTSDTDTIVAPLEVLFAAQRPGTYVLHVVCPTCTPQEWLRQIGTQLPAAYVLTFKEDGRYTQVTRDAQVQAVLARCYAEQIIGSYLIYLRTADTCAVTAKR